jgi:hypothetical protein
LLGVGSLFYAFSSLRTTMCFVPQASSVLGDSSPRSPKIPTTFSSPCPHTRCARTWRSSPEQTIDAVRKLQLAGADHVVSPYTMAGQQMAMLAVRPIAVDFVET